MSFVSAATGAITAQGDHGDGGPQHQDLRRHGLGRGRADDYRGQPGRGRRGGLQRTYNSENAGIGKTLTAAGSVSDGNGGGNYAVTLAANTAAAIAARAITVAAATGTKGYDGTTSSTAAPAVTSGNLATGDAAAFTETYDTRNAGTGKTLRGGRLGGRRQRRRQLRGELRRQDHRRDHGPGDHGHRGRRRQGLRRHGVGGGHADGLAKR